MQMNRPAVCCAALFALAALAVGFGLSGAAAAFSAGFALIAAVFVLIKPYRGLRTAFFFLLCAVLLLYPVLFQRAEDRKTVRVQGLFSGAGETYAAQVDRLISFSGADGAVLRVTLCDAGLPVLLKVDHAAGGRLPERFDRITFDGKIRPLNPQTMQAFSFYGQVSQRYADGTFLAARTSGLKTGGRLPGAVGNPAVRYYYYISDRLRRVFPVVDGTDTFAYVCALLTGDQNQLPETDIYTHSGLMPFLCISGLHVAAAARLLEALLRRLRLSRFAQLPILLLFLWFLTVATGAKGAVMRAAGMYAVLSVCNTLWLDADPFSALSAALIFILLRNPFAVFDIGTELSFLAMIGVLYAGEAAEDFHAPPMRKGISVSLAKALTSGFATTGFVMLPAFFIFGGVYLLTPFSMLIAGAVFTPLLFLLTLLAMTAFLPDAMLSLLAMPAVVLLKLFERVAALFSQIPYAFAALPADLSASFSMTALACVWGALFCAVLFSAAFLRQRALVVTGFFAVLLPQLVIPAAYFLSLALGFS